MTGSRLHETHLPWRTIVLPVQLCLLPELVAGPPPVLFGELAAPSAAAAVTLLAGLIAKAAGTAVAGAGAGDE